MIFVTATIEYDLRNARLLRFAGDRRADRLRGGNVGLRAERGRERLVDRRDRGQRVPLAVVDDQRVDVMERTPHAQARALRRPRQLLAKTNVALPTGFLPARHFFPAFPALPSFLRMGSPS